MCHLCETRRICERIERQIANIKNGGAISPDAIARLLSDAHADLGRYRTAVAASDAIMRGMAVAEVVIVAGAQDDGSVH